MDGAEDWIETNGLRRWIESCDDWEEQPTPTTRLVIPDNKREFHFGQKWYTRIPPSVKRVVSQHSYRQASGKTPRYQQHTVASLMKQRQSSL